jgi:hypothetical protein
MSRRVTVRIAVALGGLAATATGALAQDAADSPGGPLQTYAVKASRLSHTQGEKLNYVRLPGANLDFQVSGADTGDFVVTFTGVCRLFGASADDWVAVQLRLDGVVPLKPTEGVLPFCGDDNYGSHAVTAFETEVSPGPHNVEVLWKVIDNDPGAELLAEIAGWTLLVLVRD